MSILSSTNSGSYGPLTLDELARRGYHLVSSSSLWHEHQYAHPKLHIFRIKHIQGKFYTNSFASGDTTYEIQDIKTLELFESYFTRLEEMSVAIGHDFKTKTNELAKYQKLIKTTIPTK